MIAKITLKDLSYEKEFRSYIQRTVASDMKLIERTLRSKSFNRRYSINKGKVQQDLAMPYSELNERDRHAKENLLKDMWIHEVTQQRGILYLNDTAQQRKDAVTIEIVEKETKHRKPPVDSIIAYVTFEMNGFGASIYPDSIRI